MKEFIIATLCLMFIPILLGVLIACFIMLDLSYINPVNWSTFFKAVASIWISYIFLVAADAIVRNLSQ